MSVIDSNLRKVSIDEVTRNLPALVQRIEAGETLIIVKAGKPIAEVKPVASAFKTLRPFGLCAGEFSVPDDFDDPLPKDIMERFGGK